MKDRGVRRDVNSRKFWKRVNKAAKFWFNLKDKENWRLRNWVANVHNCSCKQCRHEARRNCGNSLIGIPIQERKLRESMNFDANDYRQEDKCNFLKQQLVEKDNLDEHQIDLN